MGNTFEEMKQSFLSEAGLTVGTLTRRSWRTGRGAGLQPSFYCVSLIPGKFYGIFALVFRVDSASGNTYFPTVLVRDLQWRDFKGKGADDIEMQIEEVKDATENFTNSEVRVHCNCPDFVHRAMSELGSEGHIPELAGAMPVTATEARPGFRSETGPLCKHLTVVLASSLPLVSAKEIALGVQAPVRHPLL